MSCGKSVLSFTHYNTDRHRAQAVVAWQLPMEIPVYIVELRVRRAHKAPATLEARSNSSAPKRGMIPAVRARSVGLIGGSLAGPRPSSNTTCRCPSAHIGEDCAVEPSKEGGHRAGDELGVDVVLRGG